MKKLLKTSLLLGAVATLGMMNTNAKTMNAEAIEKMSALDDSLSAYGNVYIMGKYVFVENVSAADIMEASDDLAYDPDYLKEYRSLFNSGRMNVIYKDYNNEWINATKASDSLVSRDKISIEMTHLIAMDDGSDHISTDESLYNSGEFVSFDDSIPGRIVELFVDQKADLSIASITSASENIDLNSDVSNALYKYNRSALEVSLSTSVNKDGNKVLTLTEKTPLTTYYRDNDTEAWIALLIKTNKAIAKGDVVSLSLNGSKTITNNDIVNSKEFGGDGVRDLVVWLKKEDLSNLKEITIQKEDEEKQTIEVVYNPILVSEEEEVPNVSEMNLNVVTEGAFGVTLQYGNGYRNIIYTNDSKLTRIDFTENNNKKVGIISDKTITFYDLIDVANPVAAKETAVNNKNYKWNQEAIANNVSIEKHERTTDELYDYVVTIKSDKKLDSYVQGVAILMDLSVDPTVLTVEESSLTAAASTYGMTSNTQFVQWVTLSSEPQDITYKNNKNNLTNNDKDEVIIRYVIVENTEKMSLKANLGKSDIDLYPNTSVEDEGKYNVAYRNNIKRATLLAPAYDESTNKYTITIQQTEPTDVTVHESTDANYKNFVQLKRTKDDEDVKKWFGIVVDLGVDPSKLDVSGYTLTEADLNDSARHGATGTAFIMWVNEDTTGDITFTNKDTHETLTIKFVINEFSNTAETDIIKDKVEADNSADLVILSEYASSVKYVKGSGFRISGDIDHFEADVTKQDAEGHSVTTRYTYRKFNGTEACGSEITCLKKVSNLQFVDVYKGIFPREGYTTQLTIDSMTITNFDKETNTVEVLFNKNIDTTGKLELVLNLGDKSLDGTIQNAITINNKVSYLSEADITKSGENLVAVVYANIATALNNNEDCVVTITRTYDGVVSMPLVINIKATVNPAENHDLKFNSVSELKIEKNFLPTLTEGLDDNQNAITLKYENGEVLINQVKALVPYAGSQTYEPQTSGTWVGMLVDLDVDPELLDGTDGANYIIDNENMKLQEYGAKSTQFILWINTASLADEVDIYGKTTGRKVVEVTFKYDNKTDYEYRYAAPISVKFVFEDIREELVLKSISKRSATASAVNYSYDESLYKINQERLNHSYDADKKTLTLGYTSEDQKTIVKYSLDGANAEYNWYALTVDFGKKVEIDPENTDLTAVVKLEPIEDSTEYILWVRRTKNNGDLIVSRIGFVDEFGMTETITLTNVDTVVE